MTFPISLVGACHCTVCLYLCLTIIIALGYSLPLIAELAQLAPCFLNMALRVQLNHSTIPSITLGVVRCGFKLLHAHRLTGVQHQDLSLDRTGGLQEQATHGEIAWS